MTTRTGSFPEAHMDGQCWPLSDEAFIDSLPKVELHVHLEGSMRPETLLHLARKHRIEGLPSTLRQIRDWYAFRDFAHFIEVYLMSVRALGDGEDFALLARTTGDRLAAQGLRYAEVTFTPWLHIARGLPLGEVFAGLEEGRMDLERRHGLRLRWIIDVPGDAGVAAADRTLEALLDLDQPALATDGGSVVGFGLGGPEVPRTPFAEVFAAARQAGLHAVPHAGEAAGPEAIWAALDDLGAERIGHGIAAMADAALINRLRDEQIALEVCPTSNVRTRVVPDLSQHPLPAMIKEGLAVTVNSDDPPMFDTCLRQELLATLDPMDLTRTQLTACMRTAINASFMSQDRKTALLTELQEAADPVTPP
jgi:aminodeoxyfutalosine deaminase